MRVSLPKLNRLKQPDTFEDLVQQLKDPKLCPRAYVQWQQTTKRILKVKAKIRQAQKEKQAKHDTTIVGPRGKDSGEHWTAAEDEMLLKCKDRKDPL